MLSCFWNRQMTLSLLSRLSCCMEYSKQTIRIYSTHFLLCFLQCQSKQSNHYKRQHCGQPCCRGCTRWWQIPHHQSTWFLSHVFWRNWCLPYNAHSNNGSNTYQIGVSHFFCWGCRLERVSVRFWWISWEKIFFQHWHTSKRANKNY